MKARAVTATLLVALSACSKHMSEGDRRRQLVDSINAIQTEQAPPASTWPDLCLGIHREPAPGDTKSCPMTEKVRDEYRSTAQDQLRAGLVAFVSECGKHRGDLADRMTADPNYGAELIGRTAQLLLPAGRDGQFKFLRAEVKGDLKRALVTCFATETLGTAELDWIHKVTFAGFPTIDDVDLLSLGQLDPKKVTAALETELTKPAH